ncbi:hypothetical protein SALBM217S_01283 [Streptomyces griseoloalbus]
MSADGFTGSPVQDRFTDAAGSPCATPAWACASGQAASSVSTFSTAMSSDAGSLVATLPLLMSDCARAAFSSSAAVSAFAGAAAEVVEAGLPLPSSPLSWSSPEPPQAVTSRASAAAEAASAVRRTELVLTVELFLEGAEDPHHVRAL